MPNNGNSIAILLSLYGNSPYLKDFLDSLAGQTLQGFRLLYRFDGSPSPEIRELLKKYPFAEQICDETYSGIPGTYWELLLHTPPSFRYLMFADQDDVWYPCKAGRSLAAIREAEKQYGSGTPLLIHSDLTVTNKTGDIVSPSFFAYQSLNPRYNRLKDLIIQNNVTGCTMMFNRPLADLMHAPVSAICHDWYLALIAAAFGKIEFISEPLLKYRQHQDNAFGAVPAVSILSKAFSRTDLKKRLALTQKQTLLFLEEFRSRLSEEQISYLEAWSGNLTERNYFKRLYSAVRYGFRKNDLLRTLGMWWAL